MCLADSFLHGIALIDPSENSHLIPFSGKYKDGKPGIDAALGQDGRILTMHASLYILELSSFDL